MQKQSATALSTRQRRYSRDEIVDAAKELLREEGRVAFSTRKLAARVGMSVMGIYTYFENKDDILDAVAESYFSAFESPPIQKNWRVFIVRWSNAVYDFFSVHPEALELIAWKDHVAGRAWRRLWLPLAKMWSAYGLKRQKLVYVTNWVSSVVLGEIQSQAHRPTPEASAQLYAELAADFPEDAPILQELAQAALGLEDKRMFDYAVRMLLIGLEASLTEKAKPARTAR
jgi:AcrR family transcriptional regulator